jgi:hypothetical protein
MTDLTHDLDLLGDWLDAKGYTEEAGLITRSMDYMHKQSEKIARLEAALSRLLNALNAGIINPPEEYVEAKRQARAEILETKYD